MSTRLSQTSLKKLYKKEIKERGIKGVSEIVNDRRHTDSRKEPSSIFLCHSHHDKTIVDKIILLFNRLNVNIYVDWMDEAMPKVTNRETAALIKSKIEYNNRFLFLATYYGLRSKWCDWELGVAYSLKKVNELAILPIESKSGRWQGSEYLKLYPVMEISKTDLENVNIDMVTIEKDNQLMTLEEWLKN